MMIVSASRRTDIPAFYTSWLLQRIEAGFVLTRNPMNARQVSRVSLDPAVVDCIVFWTKNIKPLLPHLQNLRKKGYEFYVQFTLNPYGRDLEPGLPGTEERIESFQKAASIVGRERLIWRYDPVIFSPQWTGEAHKRAFARLAAAIAPAAAECVFSFITQYRKTRRNTAALQLTADPRPLASELLQSMADTAAAHQLPLNSCSENTDYSSYGIGHTACISRERIEILRGQKLPVKKDPHQRTACGCASSIDMGAYNTCHHGCRYCYANFSPKAVAATAAAHDPNSPLITGTIGPEDVITDRKAVSLPDGRRPLR